MSTDDWQGGTHKFTRAGSWSDGVPTASTNALIASGVVDVTAPFALNWFQIQNEATLSFAAAGSSVAQGACINSGQIDLDTQAKGGGSAWTIAGTLKNWRTLQIGADDGSLAKDSTVVVGGLVNSGAHSLIVLDGGAAARATLMVGGPPGLGSAGAISGGVNLSGQAALIFTGQITRIAHGSALNLLGPDAFVEDASVGTDADTALKSLDEIGGYFGIANGGRVAIGGNLLVDAGELSVDVTSRVVDNMYYNADGGSSVSVRGQLTIGRLGQVAIGNISLSANALLTAASLDNAGRLSLQGTGTHSGQIHVSGSVLNSGEINLFSASTELAGPISGTGNIVIESGLLSTFGSALTVDAAVSQGQTVQFQAIGGLATPNSLILDDAADFAGTILGFGHQGGSTSPQSEIDLAGFGTVASLGYVANAQNTGGTLTVTGGSTSTHLTFEGSYSASGFTATSDHAGGSFLLYQAHA